MKQMRKKISDKVTCVRRKLLTYSPPLERTPNQILAVCKSQVERNCAVSTKSLLGMLEIFCDKDVDLRRYFDG